MFESVDQFQLLYFVKLCQIPVRKTYVNSWFKTLTFSPSLLYIQSTAQRNKNFFHTFEHMNEWYQSIFSNIFEEIILQLHKSDVQYLSSYHWLEIIDRSQAQFVELCVYWFAFSNDSCECWIIKFHKKQCQRAQNMNAKIHEWSRIWHVEVFVLFIAIYSNWVIVLF